MYSQNFNQLISSIEAIPRVARDGSVIASKSGIVKVRGLSKVAHIGDLVSLHRQDGSQVYGEVLSIAVETIDVLPETGVEGVALNDRVSHHGAMKIMPDASWLGRVVDPLLRPIDGHPISNGPTEAPLKRSPPPPAKRKRLGLRLSTKMAVFDTLLPIVKGQRIGIFAGSGVGKSTLISDLAKGVEADIVVITLIGERGREVREFIEDTLGADGLKRAIIVAATSDQSAMIRRRGAWVGMAIAEHFRDQGAHVLLLSDSVTRFAEAHREISLSAGETASLQGYPPSTSQELMALSERAGPGNQGQGDITAVFSVLVQGSNMEGPIADIMRGVLDGHVVLAREIAQRGRFPAVDVSRSISRSLPAAASAEEQETLKKVRNAISLYEESEALIKSGLYEPGSNSDIDFAIHVRPKIETLLANRSSHSMENSYSLLKQAVEEGLQETS